MLRTLQGLKKTRLPAQCCPDRPLPMAFLRDLAPWAKRRLFHVTICLRSSSFSWRRSDRQASRVASRTPTDLTPSFRPALRKAGHIVCLVSSTTFVEFSKAQSFEHPGGLYSNAQIEKVRAKVEAAEQPWKAAYDALIVQARKYREREPRAIQDFHVPGYYQHPEANKKVLKRLSLDAWAAYSSAVAYRLTSGSERVQYADKVVQMLTAWAVTNTNATGGDGNLVMTYTGVGLIFAAELITDYDGWKRVHRKLFSAWVNSVYLRSCNSIKGRKDNWGDWGILGCIAAHYFLDDVQAVDLDIDHIRKKIDAGIEADGRMPIEVSRGKNGIWYTYFALAPLTAACQIAVNARQADCFAFKGKDGSGIEEALDYLLRYSLAPNKWPYYKKKDLNRPKPKRWPGNLFEAMHNIYDKKEYESWIEDHRPIMIYGHHYAWAMPTLLSTVTE